MREDHALKYATRDELCKLFGFFSYKAYLRSDEWRAIRNGVLAEYPECICCHSPSKVVHHVKYDSATLLGLHSLNLAPLCRECHERIEIMEDGTKACMSRANTLMLELVRKKNPKQLWLHRFYHDRKKWKRDRQVDAHARRAAWRRKRDEKENPPRDYSGVFWIRARRR